MGFGACALECAHHMLFILAVDLGLAWMEEHARCAGCENGGGPPDCTIRFTLERKDTIYAAPEGLCRRNGWDKDQELTIPGANYMY